MSTETRDLTDVLLANLLVDHEGYAAVAFLAFDSIPCDHFRPELKTLAEKLAEWVKFYRLEVVENPTITVELKVSAVPTLVLFKSGVEVQRWEGPYTAVALEERIRKEIRRTA